LEDSSSAMSTILVAILLPHTYSVVLITARKIHSLFSPHTG
jgi:hypothetical protein